MLDDAHGWEWPDIGALPVTCSNRCSGKVDETVRRAEEGTCGAVIDSGFSIFPYGPSLVSTPAEGPCEVPAIPCAGNPWTQPCKSRQRQIPRRTGMHCHAAGAGIKARGGS